VVLAALFLFGVTETFGDTTTTTLLPMLVDKPDLGIANSRAMTSVRQRAVPAQFQGRVGSVYLTGVVGGIVIGSALGGLVASAWGVTAPFWFAFAGSALILAVIWRSLLNIAHADEHARASASAAPANGCRYL
jgi:predicted MFS family arabinose efflux permease